MKSTKEQLELIEEYKYVYKENTPPDWAVQNRQTKEKIYPATPFVGQEYFNSDCRILLYASAENLTYYEENSNKNPLLETEEAWLRRRISFERNKDCRFPNIHMAPINNGGLLSSVAVLAEALSLIKVDSDPYRFIERLSIDNFAKFSQISSPGKKSKHLNPDYIDNEDMLSHSFPYIKIDLSTLKPDCIILPKKAFGVKAVQNIFKKFCPSSKIIPIYQLTATVVNCTIAKQVSEDEMELRKTEISQKIQEWVKGIRIKGMKKDGMYYFFEHMMQQVN